MAAPKEISDGKTYMHICYARHPSHHWVIIHDSHVVGFAQTNPGSDVTGWLDPQVVGVFPSRKQENMY
jgi:hypothetical protein